jgi:hypothetical protein
MLTKLHQVTSKRMATILWAALLDVPPGTMQVNLSRNLANLPHRTHDHGNIIHCDFLLETRLLCVNLLDGVPVSMYAKGVSIGCPARGVDLALFVNNHLSRAEGLYKYDLIRFGIQSKRHHMI